MFCWDLVSGGESLSWDHGHEFAGCEFWWGASRACVPCWERVRSVVFTLLQADTEYVSAGQAFCDGLLKLVRYGKG